MREIDLIDKIENMLRAETAKLTEEISILKSEFADLKSAIAEISDIKETIEKLNDSLAKSNNEKAKDEEIEKLIRIVFEAIINTFESYSPQLSISGSNIINKRNDSCLISISRDMTLTVMPLTYESMKFERFNERQNDNRTTCA